MTFFPEDAAEDNRWIVESWPKRLEEQYWRDPKVRQTELIATQTPRVKGGEERYQQKGYDATVTHLGNWLESIRTRKPHWEDAGAGHRAAACAHMVNLAARSGRAVEWDFVKDDIKS